MELTGKTAVVTGAAVRLGRAIALELAAAGCDVVVHYGSHAEEADAVVRRICDDTGRRAVAVHADLRDPVRGAATLFAAVRERFGRADVLVNNAAIYEPGDFGTITEDHWDRHLGLNLKAPFFLAQRFAEQFEGDGGSLVNILCRRATRPTAEDLPYTAAKAGLLALTKGLALRLAPAIRVNGVAPGEMLPPAGRGETPEEWESRVRAAVPLDRVGGADPVAGAVRYLCEAEYVTGEVLHVTGGDHL
ncbi:SDR family NAD(P)-dependent oxidoreductase [Alienimonas sp. DA493]|uniref:SDR family NAD(P)-dependent oxidoreductase n=1 Tax=Alienimonas sp. DA493 TaxID=3373605 RepID=UPI003753F05E